MAEQYKAPTPDKQESKQPEKIKVWGAPLTPEKEAEYGQYILDHRDVVVAPDKLRDSEPEIAEFEGMIAGFVERHSLAELHSVKHLTAEEAPYHPARKPAELALKPIVVKLNVLKEQTNISPEMHELLRASYLRLSRAVGIINKDNLVDHDRWGKPISDEVVINLFKERGLEDAKARALLNFWTDQKERDVSVSVWSVIAFNVYKARLYNAIGFQEYATDGFKDARRMALQEGFRDLYDAIWHEMELFGIDTDDDGYV